MVLRPVFKCHSKYTGFGADWAGSAPIRRPYWNEPGSVAHGFELAGSSQRISFRTQLQGQAAACEFIQESQKIKKTCIKEWANFSFRFRAYLYIYVEFDLSVFFLLIYPQLGLCNDKGFGIMH